LDKLKSASKPAGNTLDVTEPTYDSPSGEAGDIRSSPSLDVTRQIPL